MEQTHIQKIQDEIQDLRNQIIKHPLYSVISDQNDLKIFMKHHVFAVWDFMSILKSLQNNLTCTSIPWFPIGDADTRFLINEIVVGEESDVDQFGKRMSHFELYMQAMNQIGANNEPIHHLINQLKAGSSIDIAFSSVEISESAKNFVKFTFEAIATNQAHIQAAIFTFGREDLIPGMFMSMVNDIYQLIPESISIFKYYLERHIEVDGDHHSHLALQMTSNLCGNSDVKWSQALEYTKRSLQMRIELWNGAKDEILASKLGTA